jgi:hypothetical protein
MAAPPVEKSKAAPISWRRALEMGDMAGKVEDGGRRERGPEGR